MEMFKVDCLALYNLLQKALFFADRKKNNPVVFRVKNGGVKVFSKNDSSRFMGEVAYLEANDMVDMRFAISGSDLLSIMEKSGSILSFKVFDNYVDLNYTAVSAKLGIINYDIDDNFEFNEVGVIDFGRLSETVGFVSKCCGKDDQFDGIFLHTKGKMLTLSATDGRRLAEYFLPFNGDISVVLDHGQFGLCKNLFDGPTSMGVASNLFFLKNHANTWCGLIKNIDFIDYSDLIINEFKNDFNYGDDLINAIKKASALSDHIRLSFEKHEVVVSSSSQSADIAIPVPVALNLEAPLTAHFSSKYLLDAFVGHRQLKFNDATSGFYFYNGENKHILMPRLSN